MSIEAEIGKLSSALQWMENKVGIIWSSTDQTRMDRTYGWSIESRGHLAMAAEDNSFEEAALEFGGAFLSQITDWEASHPAAWHAKMKYLVNVALLMGQKAVGNKARYYLPRKREEFSDQIFKSLIPEIDRFARNAQVLGVIGEAKTMNLWVRAYSIAAWAQRGMNQDRAFRLLAKLADCVNGYPGAKSNIKDAATFALGAVLHSELQPDTAIQAWKLTKVLFTPDSDPVGNKRWLLNAAAELGRLSFFLPNEERRLTLENMRQLVSCWDDERIQDKNGAYAIYYVIQAMIGYAESVDSQQLVPDDQALLVAMLEKSHHTALKLAAIDSIIQLLPNLLTEDVLAHFCQAFIGALPQITKPEEQLSVIYALRCFATQAGGEALENTWQVVCQSGPVQQVVWLFHLKGELRQASEYRHALIDIAGLQTICHCWGQEVTGELKMQWLDAVTQMASNAVLQNDTETLQKLADGFQDQTEQDQLTWLIVMSIVTLSAARHEHLLAWSRRVVAMPVSQDKPLLVLAKVSALSVLRSRLEKLDDYAAALVQTELARLGVWHIEANWVKALLEENAHYLANQLFFDWQRSRREITLDQSHTLLRQLMGLEYRSAGSAISFLLSASHWLLRHPGKADPRILEDIEIIHRFALPTAFARMPSDFVVFQIFTGRDKRFFAQVLRSAQDTGLDPRADITGEQKSKVMAQLFPIDGIEYQPEDNIKLQTLPLPWYKNVELIQLTSPDWHNARVYFLSCRGQYYRLDGRSEAIHRVNDNAQLQLTDEYVLDYLRFFTFFCRGEEGPFYILESPRDKMLPCLLNKTDIDSIHNQAKPATLHGLNHAGQYVCEATIYYADGLFATDLLVHPTGMVDMLDDQPLADLSVRLDHPLVLPGND